MKMHVLSGGRLRMRKSIYFPDVAKDATIEMPVSCILLKHPKGNVLFDTGCHPSAATDPEGRWGALAKVMTPISGEGNEYFNRTPGGRGGARRNQFCHLFSPSSRPLRLQ